MCARLPAKLAKLKARKRWGELRTTIAPIDTMYHHSLRVSGRAGAGGPRTDVIQRLQLHKHWKDVEDLCIVRNHVHKYTPSRQMRDGSCSRNDLGTPDSAMI